MPEATQAQEVQDAGEAPIIPGTTYRTPEEAAKGFAEMQALVDRQGNELGSTRKQLEQSSMMLEKFGNQQEAAPQEPAGPDYDTEISKIDQQIEKLDVDDPDYSKVMSELSRQARAMEVQKAKAETEQKLMGHFEKTLSDRDSQQAQMGWKSENPDFETPEMQQAIQQHMAQDKTGMMDPVLAYREIQLQQSAQQMQQFQTENEDFRNRLKLKSGENAVGKVTTKTGGNPGVVRQPKQTGAALDQGMLDAFRSAG